MTGLAFGFVYVGQILCWEAIQVKRACCLCCMARRGEGKTRRETGRFEQVILGGF